MHGLSVFAAAVRLGNIDKGCAMRAGGPTWAPEE